MSFIVDLDKEVCSSDIKDALIPNEKIVFKISRKNPYFEYIKSNYRIVIVKDKGDVVYFKISSIG